MVSQTATTECEDDWEVQDQVPDVQAKEEKDRAYKCLMCGRVIGREWRHHISKVDKNLVLCGKHACEKLEATIIQQQQEIERLKVALDEALTGLA